MKSLTYKVSETWVNRWPTLSEIQRFVDEAYDIRIPPDAEVGIAIDHGPLGSSFQVHFRVARHEDL